MSKWLMCAVIACVAVVWASATKSAFAVGGSGGQAFIMQCNGSEKISAVLVQAGKRLNNIGIECRTANTKKIFKAGGSDGKSHRVEFDIVDNYISMFDVAIGKCGKKTTRVCGVRMWLKKGGWTEFLGDKTNDVRTFKGDLAQEVGGKIFELYGFKGRSGDEVDNLEPLFRVRNTPAPQRMESMRGSLLADAFNVVLGKIDMRLHNWGERHGDSWHAENASWIEFRPLSLTRRFTIKEATFRRDNGLWRFFFYVNDIKTEKMDLRFSANANAFIFRIEFEGGGKEIKGLCRYKKPNGGYTNCPGDSDSPVPDIEWSNPAVEVNLIPVVYNRDGVNGVTLKAQAVMVKGDFRIDGMCGRAQNECKRLIGDWEGKLRQGVEAGVQEMLNQDQFRRAMAQATRTAMNAADIRSNIVRTYITGDRVYFGF